MLRLLLRKVYQTDKGYTFLPDGRGYLIDVSQAHKERQRLEAQIDGMFLILYIDKAKGVLTEQQFMKLTAALEQEQESNQKRLQNLTMMQRRSDEQESEVRTFIREIR